MSHPTGRPVGGAASRAVGRAVPARATGKAPGRALRLAHRGDHRSAPENSLEALRAALVVPGGDGVELDVRASADGVAILLHDPTLARVQGRPEAASELTAAELGRLGIPTLAAALAAVPPPVFLDFELKEDVAVQVVEAVRVARGELPPAIVLSSFEHVVLERLGDLAPSWPRWLNTLHLDDTTITTAVGLGCRGVSVEWRALDVMSVGAAREAGLEVAAWTVRDRRTAAQLDRLGVVAQCVEGPALEG